MSLPSKHIAIYTDGACSPNPGPGGYGIVIIDETHPRQELSGGFRKTTNNRMELFSVIMALQELSHPQSTVTVFSDSQYVVNMINGGYAHQWRRDGWKRNKGKDPALNPDLWNELLSLCARHHVTFTWVRGHSEHPENTRCDELAVAARRQANLPADKGYEMPAKPPEQLSLF